MKTLAALLLIASAQESDPRAEFERLLNIKGFPHMADVPDLIFSDDEETFLRGATRLQEFRSAPVDAESTVQLNFIAFRRARVMKWQRGQETFGGFILTYLKYPFPKIADQLRADLAGLLKDAADPAGRRMLKVMALADGRAPRADLLDFVKDSRTEVRAAAFHRLEDLHDPADTPLLASMLKDPEPMIQNSGIQTLGRRGAAEHIDDIAKFLDDRWYFNRRAAIDAIGRMKVHRLARRIVPFLADPADRGSDARTHALAALKALDPGNAIEDVAAFLGHEQPGVRKSAVVLLAHWKSKRHAPLISPLLSDPDAKVREEAVDALSAMAVTDMAELIVRRLEDDADMVRARAAIALGELGAKDRAGKLVALGREGRIAKGAVVHSVILLSPERTDAIVDLIEAMIKEIKPDGRHGPVREVRIPSAGEVIRLACRKGLDDCIVALIKRVKESAPTFERMILHAVSESGTAALLKKLGDQGLIVSREAQAHVLEGFKKTLTEATIHDLMDLVRKLDPTLTGHLDTIERKLPEWPDAVATFTEDESPKVRRLAGVALCQSRKVRHLGRLIKLMEDPDQEVRAYVTQMAAYMPSTDHHEAIGRRLADPEPWVRSAAVSGVGGMKLDQFAPDVVALLQDPDASVVTSVLYALERLDIRKEAARLIPLLKNPKRAARAAELLGKTEGPEAVGPLAVLAKDGEPEARGAAIRSLAILGAQERLTDLEALFADRSEFVRSASVFAAGRFKQPKWKPALIELLKDPRHLVKAEAATALAELGATDEIPGILALLDLPDDQPIVLAEGGHRSSRHVAEDAAAAALIKLNAKETAPKVAELLKKKKNDLFALQRLGFLLIRFDAKAYIPEILSADVRGWKTGALYELNRARAPKLFEKVSKATVVDPRLLERASLAVRAETFGRVFGVRIVMDPSVSEAIRSREDSSHTTHLTTVIPHECSAVFDEEAGEIRIMTMEAARGFWLEWAKSK